MGQSENLPQHRGAPEVQSRVGGGRGSGRGVTHIFVTGVCSWEVEKSPIHITAKPEKTYLFI